MGAPARQCAGSDDRGLRHSPPHQYQNANRRDPAADDIVNCPAGDDNGCAGNGSRSCRGNAHHERTDKRVAGMTSEQRRKQDDHQVYRREDA